MNLNLLFVEDHDKLRENLIKSFDRQTIAGYELLVTAVKDFEKGIELIKTVDFDIVILDLYKDSDGTDPEDENAGVKVLEAIRKNVFVPVVFFTGHAHKISHLVSEVVGVVSKGDGIAKLAEEIERIINSKLALLKKHINAHVSEQLRDYFWETVDSDKGLFIPQKSDFSLGYLLLRRLANSLSKENIKVLLGDDKIKTDKAHPMEFYLYPVNPDSKIEEYQAGEIIKKDDLYFVVLTPSCDLVLRNTGTRKANKILLAAADKFTQLPDFIKYDELKKKTNKSEKENEQFSNYKGKLKVWMNNRGGEQDRYFFLPGTPFIENLVIDFENKLMVNYDDLKAFQRVAKLDDPFAQSMTASFIRFYNRIGFPDIDVDYVIQKL